MVPQVVFDLVAVVAVGLVVVVVGLVVVGGCVVAVGVGDVPAVGLVVGLVVVIAVAALVLLRNCSIDQDQLISFFVSKRQGR